MSKQAKAFIPFHETRHPGNIPDKAITTKPTITYNNETKVFTILHELPGGGMSNPLESNNFGEAFEIYDELYKQYIKSNLVLKREKNGKFKIRVENGIEADNPNLKFYDLEYETFQKQVDADEIANRWIDDAINQEKIAMTAFISTSKEKDGGGEDANEDGEAEDDNNDEDDDNDGEEAENIENTLRVVGKKRGRNKNTTNVATIVRPVLAETKEEKEPGVQAKKIVVKKAIDPLEYKGISPELFLLKQLQLVLLQTGLNDFNHDFGHEKIIDYLKNVNINLGNITISSVEFEKKRIQFAMGSGGKSGAKIVKEISEAYEKLTNKKIKNDKNLVPAQWKDLIYLADIGKKKDEEFENPNIYKIYKGLKYKYDNDSASLGESELPLDDPVPTLTELQQITDVVGFPFQTIVNILNPEPDSTLKNFPVDLDPSRIVDSLNKLEDKIVKKLLGRPESDITEITDKSIKFTPKLLIPNEDEENGESSSSPSKLERQYYIHPVPVKIEGKRVYLPGAIKRAAGDNPKILILIDASNLSMKSLGEKLQSLATNYGPEDAIQVLILFNNANLADSAMKLSKSIIKDEGINLTILFGTELIGSTNRYPRADAEVSLAYEVQNKALFNNFAENITKKESMKRISSEIKYNEYTNKDTYTEETLHINDLGEESEISSVSSKIVLDYLELNGKVSTKSMVRGQTKKSGDSNQAISLLDENRKYYYCNILGEAVNLKGERLKPGDYVEFTLSSLKDEGWVIYLLTHDKVLLSIALLLGINILYTLKLLFRFSSELIKEFGTLNIGDDEDSKSKSITWLIGFQNAKENVAFDETQIAKLKDLYYDKWKVKVEDLKELSKQSIVETEKYYRTYIKDNFFGKLAVNQIPMYRFIQVLYCYFDILKQIPKQKDITNLETILDSSMTNIQNTEISDSKRKAASNLLEKTALDLNIIDKFFKNFGIFLTNNVTAENNAEELWKKKMDKIVSDMIHSTAGYKQYGIKSVAQNLRRSNYDDAMKVSNEKEWQTYKANYEKEVNNLIGYLKYFQENHITPFQNTQTQEDLVSPDEFISRLNVLQPTRKSRITQTPAEVKIKELYEYIYKLKDMPAQAGGGVELGAQDILVEQNSENGENGENNETQPDILKQIYTILSTATVTVIRDDGILLQYYNHLVNEYYKKLGEYIVPNKSKKADLDNITNYINNLYMIFNNPSNKPIYDCNHILPLEYCLDEMGQRFELTQIFSTDKDIYVEIPLLYPKIIGKIGRLYLNNKAEIDSKPELHLIFEKLRLYYYETKLIQYYEKKRSYQHFMLKQFSLNNRNIQSDIDTKDFLKILNDDYLNIINDIITNYRLAFVNCQKKIEGLKNKNEKTRELMSKPRLLAKKIITSFSNLINVSSIELPLEKIMAKLKDEINKEINDEINKIRNITHLVATLPNLSNELFKLKNQKPMYYAVPKEDIQKLYDKGLTKETYKPNTERSVNLLTFDEYAVNKINNIQKIIDSKTNGEKAARIFDAQQSNLFINVDFLTNIPSYYIDFIENENGENENGENENGENENGENENAGHEVENTSSPAQLLVQSGKHGRNNEENNNNENTSNKGQRKRALISNESKNDENTEELLEIINSAEDNAPVGVQQGAPVGAQIQGVQQRAPVGSQIQGVQQRAPVGAQIQGVQQGAPVGAQIQGVQQGAPVGIILLGSPTVSPDLVSADLENSEIENITADTTRIEQNRVFVNPIKMLRSSQEYSTLNDDFDNYFNLSDSVDSIGVSPLHYSNSESSTRIGMSKSASEISINQLDSSRQLVSSIPVKRTVVGQTFQTPKTVAQNQKTVAQLPSTLPSSPFKPKTVGTVAKLPNSEARGSSNEVAINLAKSGVFGGAVFLIKNSRKNYNYKKRKTQKRKINNRKTRKH